MSAFCLPLLKSCWMQCKSKRRSCLLIVRFLTHRLFFLCWTLLPHSFVFGSSNDPDFFSFLSFICSGLAGFFLSLPFPDLAGFFFSPVVLLNSLLSSSQTPFLQLPNPSQPPLPLRNLLFWSPWQQLHRVNVFARCASDCILYVLPNQSAASRRWQMLHHLKGQ